VAGPLIGSGKHVNKCVIFYLEMLGDTLLWPISSTA
jgi:hypothetical protein